MMARFFLLLALSATLSAGPIPEKKREKWSFVVTKRRTHSGSLHMGPGGKPIRYYYLLNRYTGDLYHEISKEAAAYKSLTIMAGTPFYTVGNMFLQFPKVVWDTGAVSYNAYCEVQESDKELQEALLEALKKSGIDLTTRIGCDLYEYITAPWFGVALFATAAKGCIYDPHEALATIAQIEGLMHLGRPAKSSDLLRHSPEILNEGADWAIYLAYCCQKIGNIDDLCKTGKPKWEILEYCDESQEGAVFDQAPCKKLPLID